MQIEFPKAHAQHLKPQLVIFLLLMLLKANNIHLPVDNCNLLVSGLHFSPLAGHKKSSKKIGTGPIFESQQLLCRLQHNHVSINTHGPVYTRFQLPAIFICKTRTHSCRAPPATPAPALAPHSLGLMGWTSAGPGHHNSGHNSQIPQKQQQPAGHKPKLCLAMLQNP